jgi:hypothetical protein
VLNTFSDAITCNNYTVAEDERLSDKRPYTPLQKGRNIGKEIYKLVVIFPN